MTIRLTKKRRLPDDTRGERVLTPYGEIHVSARTLELWRDWKRTAASGEAVGRVAGALVFDFSAELISRGLVEEINKRLGRAIRGKRALKPRPKSPQRARLAAEC
jgi:hypothetical protein